MELERHKNYTVQTTLTHITVVVCQFLHKTGDHKYLYKYNYPFHIDIGCFVNLSYL